MTGTLLRECPSQISSYHILPEMAFLLGSVCGFKKHSSDSLSTLPFLAPVKGVRTEDRLDFHDRASLVLSLKDSSIGRFR